MESWTVKELLTQYVEVFYKTTGTMKHIRANLTPRVHPPHLVPYAIRDMVGRKLDCLEEAGVLWQMNDATWAAPLISVPGIGHCPSKPPVYTLRS